MSGGTEGDSRRRSGRRSSEPLQHITLGGGPATPEDEEDVSASANPEPAEGALDEPPPGPGGREPQPKSTLKPASKGAPKPAAAPPRGSARTGPGYTRAAESIRTGLDRIKPRPASPARGSLGSTAADRDPLGRAALYSSAADRRQPLLGTFLVECSACRRETPVTAGDLVRLGVPSLHLPFVKRFPSLMRCPACGRRTWVRVHWRL